jgi:hypothetical protein
LFAQGASANSNSKNANNWHWEEKNIKDWAFERLKALLKESDIPVQGNAPCHLLPPLSFATFHYAADAWPSLQGTAPLQSLR